MSTEKLEYRAMIKFLNVEGLKGKHIDKKMPHSPGEQYSSYATVKKVIANFRRDKFSIKNQSG